MFPICRKPTSRLIENAESSAAIALIATVCCPLAAIIGAEPKALHCRGDVMTYDADSTVQLQRDLRLQLRGYAVSTPSTTCCEHIVPRIEMVISSWYLDEFGNPTREIRARD